VKPTPRTDFPVSARSYAQENQFDRPELTKRAFWLRLNNSVTVAFVPTVGDLKDTSSLDLDNPRDEHEASTVLALENHFVVTTNNEQAGREEIVQLEGDGGAQVVLFFVTEADYAQYVSDLEDIGQRTGWALRSSTVLSELPEMPVLTFVNERFLASPQVDAYSKRLLGR
jgi:hypothetical protein